MTTSVRSARVILLYVNGGRLCNDRELTTNRSSGAAPALHPPSRFQTSRCRTSRFQTSRFRTCCCQPSRIPLSLVPLCFAPHAASPPARPPRCLTDPQQLP